MNKGGQCACVRVGGWVGGGWCEVGEGPEKGGGEGYHCHHAVRHLLTLPRLLGSLRLVSTSFGCATQ